MINRQRRVCIVIFDEVEVLDFCGPFEVFSVTGNGAGLRPFDVYTVSADQRPIKTRGGLSINPHFTLDRCPQSDIVLVPGGPGTRRQMHNAKLLEWIKARSVKTELMLSVCSGALILAQAGLLDGLTVTTHHGAMDELRAVTSNAHVDEKKRFVDNGRIVVSAGIAAGIDMSLHVVSRLLGRQEAVRTARYMEYEWQPEQQSRSRADAPGPGTRRHQMTTIKLGSKC